MKNSLGLGDVRVGHLIDGVDDGFPDQTATLTFDQNRGAELAVPYLVESKDGPNPQYQKSRRWFNFNRSALPETLIYKDNHGIVTLVGTHVAGVAGGRIGLGRVRAQAAIFNAPREYRDEYRIKDFRSTIDGLEEFARFSPVNHWFETTEQGNHRTVVAIDASESIEWEAGGFQYAIEAHVPWSATNGRNFIIDDTRPRLVTSRDEGATIAEHLGAQWPVRALLVLVHGTRMAWRSHTLFDEEFPAWTVAGTASGAHSVEVQVASTVAEHQATQLSPHTLALSPFGLGDLGADGMRRWIELYSDDTFRRAVQPGVEVVNGAGEFVEPQLMMLAISLDRFGYFRFSDKRRRPMHVHIERCLEAASLSWPQIGSNIGIAKAIAGVNNDLKHPDRESYPDAIELAGLTSLSKIIMRAQLFDLLGLDDECREYFLSGNDAGNAVYIFEQSKLTVTDEGTFIRG